MAKKGGEVAPDNYPFKCDAFKRSERRITGWYYNNLMKVLLAQKEKRVKDVDKSIALAKEFQKILDEKVSVAKHMPPHDVVPSADASLMRPVSRSALDLLHHGTEKGCTDRYLHERNKQSPEEKYFFRLQTSWDYGWMQKVSRLPAHDFNRGRCAILRETFYRNNNLAPDPPHYGQPSGGEVSICSEYSCNFN